MGMATKMTFGEWCAAILLGGTAGILIYLLFLPLGLLMAWMRVKMWDWFMVPYFHLPHISVWLMFALVIFVTSITYNANPDLKDDHYKASAGTRIFMPFAVQALGFLIAYLIHLWILKG
jgi:hypothetical protein